MTLVVAHAPMEPSKIVVIADSRVSSGAPLLDSVAKILPLPVRISNQNGVTLYQGTFGFAFTGSALVAKSVHSFVSSALLGLRSTDGNKAISLSEIGEFVGNTLKLIATEMGQRGRKTGTELLVFGFCPVAQSRKLYKTQTDFSDGSFNVAFGELPISDTGTAYVFGDSDAIKRFDLEMEGLEKPDVMMALDRVIKSPDIPTVGGSVHYMCTDETGAYTQPILYRTERGTVVVKLLNHEVDNMDIGTFNLKNRAIGILDL